MVTTDAILGNRALIVRFPPTKGSYPMAVDVMLCYVHVAYVHIRHSNAFGIDFPRPMDPLQVSICRDCSLNFTVV